MPIRKRDRVILLLLAIACLAFLDYLGPEEAITYIVRLGLKIMVVMVFVLAALLYIHVKDHDEWKRARLAKKRFEERGLRPKPQKPKPPVSRRVKSKKRF